ncbi:DNA gyrase subunit A [Candidatus Dojkabacteria bacterium]|nr:DNA gyrase subunit A [Candidatus Dojkabacteria bacterium]
MNKEKTDNKKNRNQLGIKHQEITEEMKGSYLNYAMSVIVSRALPDAKDGLKPVQRRILYAMNKQGFLHNKPYKKSARTVGEVIGKYHPHGDVAVYDAMVRLTQDFNVRYPLVDGQGNFGSIDGDNAAAMRYTEARLQQISKEILEGINNNTVDYRPNYDGSTEEPEVLPSKLPLLLLNGADGIAVGMATKIPPHNLTEVSDAIIELINNGNKADKIIQSIPNYKEIIQNEEDLKKLNKDRFHTFETDYTVNDLIEIVQGPDFPTGGEIYDQSETINAYETGKGRIVMRAIAEIKDAKRGKYQIIVTEIPYQVNKARLVSKIAQLVKDDKVDGISDIRDESSKEGLRIVIDIKRDGKPKSILNRLYKYTEMQKSFNANMLALVDNEPQVITLKKALELFIEHRQEVIVRRTEYELAKSREREHILEGLMIALENLDEVIKTIRESKDADIAKTELIKKFKLSEIQAQAILDMQLRRLAALERQKIEDEYKEIKKTIKDLLLTLSNPEKVLEIIKKETEEIKEKYGDERRTKVNKQKIGEISEEDLVPSEDVIVTVSQQGYIKRIKQNSYQVQKRGGVGKKFMTTKDDDSVSHVFSCNTHDDILFFTNKGKVYQVKVYDVPEYSRRAKGQPIINIINIDQDEIITSILTRSKEGHLIDEDVLQEEEVDSEHEGAAYKYLMMATEKGTVKKTKISKFENIQSNGLIAIKLSKGDKLAWVKPTTGDNEIVLVSKYGRSIRFHETDVRDTGRATMGVIGIKFKDPNDEIIVMDLVRHDEFLMLSISENGYGKVTTLEEYPLQKRAGQGVYTAKITKKTGNLAAARILDHPKKELLIMSENGQAVKIPTEDLPKRQRQTLGVRLIRLKKDDTVAAIAII